MRKKALRKDFYMEIRKNFGRFLSIFFIVALGVSFLSGIRASEPDMRLSGDACFDKRSLMDIKVMSTLGITEDDVDAIQKIDGVEKAEGSYSTDALCSVGNKKKVLHVMSSSDDINKVEIIKGRLPQKDNECLIDTDFLAQKDYKIGDTIHLEGENLKHEKYKIVGIGNHPFYISFKRGSSTIGNGEVAGFLIVDEDAFDMEVYTEAYVRVEGAEKEIAFTDAYQEKVQLVMDGIEDISEDQCILRIDEIVAEAQKKVEEARAELETKKQEAQLQIEENEQKLKDGEAALEEGKSQIQYGKNELQIAKALLTSKKAELEAGEVQYKEGKKQLEAGKKEYNANAAKFQSQYDEGMKKIREGEALISEKETELYNAKAKLEGIRAMIDSSKEYLIQIDEWLLQHIEEDAAKQEYEKIREEVAGKIADLERQYADGMQEIQEGEAVLASKKAELAVAKEQLTAGKTKIDQAKFELDFHENELAQAKAQIDAGKQQIQETENILSSKTQELSQAEMELFRKEAELNIGKEELEKAKTEVEYQIQDGERKIQDAEDEVLRLEAPVWYIFDRDALPEYSEYGSNADRMKAIGKVFPVLFFLVAALISLTTMTRMVEEQRTQIGTLKALGYSKADIIGKYMKYAILATLGGSVFGVLIGEKVFPFIIVYAYQIMYIHIPDIVIPYQWQYGITATGIALVCTLSATLAACYKELVAQPAVLMRPAAPKQGKRILLERMTFFWRRLNFTWKSTLRNMIRYKKRFFMTIFGIGGCMSLLLVGFGLKDSIFNIADLQYGQLQMYNGSIFMSDDITTSTRAKVEEYLGSNVKIDDYMNTYMKNITAYSDNEENDAYITVMGDKQKIKDFFNLRDRKTHEEYVLSNDGVIITEKLAKMLGVKEGDSIYLKNIQEQKQQVKITNICENYMGHYIYMTPKVYEKIYGRDPVYNSIILKSDASENDLHKIGEKLLKYEGVMNVQYMEGIKKQMNDMLKSLNIVIVVLIVSAGMLAFVVLYNLNNININERKRELATIKVLGFYDMEVAAYVYRENVLLTLIGAGLGCVLGNILHRFVIVTVEVDLAMFGRTIYPYSYLFSLLFTIGFSAFVNWVMYYKLKKISMVESLKSVE